MNKKTITPLRTYFAPEASVDIIRVERNFVATTDPLQDMETNEILDEDF